MNERETVVVDISKNDLREIEAVRIPPMNRWRCWLSYSRVRAVHLMTLHAHECVGGDRVSEEEK